MKKIDKFTQFFEEQKIQLRNLKVELTKERYNLKDVILRYVDAKFKDIEKQLQCAAKGHNFVFDKLIQRYFRVLLNTSTALEDSFVFQFKCSRCDLTITKTKDELTSKEKKALIDLKILEEKSDKNSRTTK